jgi:hypothetical protein
MLKALTGLLIAGAAALAIASPAAAAPVCGDGNIQAPGGIAYVELDQYCDSAYYDVTAVDYAAGGMYPGTAWYTTGTGLVIDVAAPEELQITVYDYYTDAYDSFYLTVY